jgi:nitrite reductase/ring-hydroxylating ferredoxin subunit
VSSKRPNRLSEDEFNAHLQRLDELIRDFEALPYPAVREKIFECLQTIDAVHREGVARLMDLLCEPGHSELLGRATQDPVIHTLLTLYDLIDNEDTLQGPVSVQLRSFVPLEQLAPVRRAQQPVLHEVARVADVPIGKTKYVVVADLHVLLANVDGEIYAVRDNCPGSAAPLHLGAFTPPIIICPWHNDAFDIRTGKRTDGQPGVGLSVLPVSVRDNVIKLATDTKPVSWPR